MKRTQERISYLFTGLAYIVVGVLVITQPRFFYYWIAGIFLLQGVASILRGVTTSPEQDNSDNQQEEQ